MYSFCLEEQKGLAYHFEGLRVPLMVRVPQFENHCLGITVLTRCRIFLQL